MSSGVILGAAKPDVLINIQSDQVQDMPRRQSHNAFSGASTLASASVAKAGSIVENTSRSEPTIVIPPVAASYEASQPAPLATNSSASPMVTSRGALTNRDPGASGQSIRLSPEQLQSLRDNPNVNFDRAPTISNKPDQWCLDYLLNYPNSSVPSEIVIDDCCSSYSCDSAQPRKSFPCCCVNEAPKQYAPYLPKTGCCGSICSTDSSKPRKSFPLCCFREPLPPPQPVIHTFPFPKEDCHAFLKFKAELDDTKQSNTIGVLSAIGGGVAGASVLIPSGGNVSLAYTATKATISIISGAGSIAGIWKTSNLNQRKAAAESGIEALIVKLKNEYTKIAGELLARWVEATPLVGRGRTFSAAQLLQAGLDHPELRRRRNLQESLGRQIQDLKLKLKVIKTDMSKYPITSLDIEDILKPLEDAIALIDRTSSFTLKVRNFNSMIATYTALRDDWNMQIEERLNGPSHLSELRRRSEIQQDGSRENKGDNLFSAPSQQVPLSAQSSPAADGPLVHTARTPSEPPSAQRSPAAEDTTAHNRQDSFGMGGYEDDDHLQLVRVYTNTKSLHRARLQPNLSDTDVLYSDEGAAQLPTDPDTTLPNTIERHLPNSSPANKPGNVSFAPLPSDGQPQRKRALPIHLPPLNLQAAANPNAMAVSSLSNPAAQSSLSSPAAPANNDVIVPIRDIAALSESRSDRASSAASHAGPMSARDSRPQRQVQAFASERNLFAKK